MIKENITWYFKQLLPLTYRTDYAKNDKKYFCVWNMWFGKCFNIKTIEMADNRFYMIELFKDGEATGEWFDGKSFTKDYESAIHFCNRGNGNKTVSILDLNNVEVTEHEYA
jgi:hypothetical protein